MHDIIEDYIDDLIMKTKIKGSNLAYLCKILYYLLEYNVRLNPKKYLFGILLGKLLGFIVSKRVIKVDPKKFKAINEIPPPQNLKEL